MANFPPTYDYPRFLDNLYNRLHPDTYVLRRGNGHQHHPALRAGLIWKVQRASPNTNVLELAALNHPEHAVPLTPEVADAVVMVRLSMYFVFEAYQVHYLRFEEEGWYLWVEDVDFPKQVRMQAYNPRKELKARYDVTINDLPLNHEEVALEMFFERLTEQPQRGLQADGFIQDEAGLVE